MVVNTATTYIIPKDVENWLMLDGTLDANSSPAEGLIESYILEAEGEFERRTGLAYRPILETHEIHDMEATKSRHREIFDDEWFSVPRPVHLNHRPVCPMDATRGHKIEVYEGSEAASSTSVPEGSWSPDYLADKTKGRPSDWWLDEMKGILYLKKAFLFRRHALVRVTYEWGQPIYTLNASATSSDTTLTATATHMAPTRGMIRVGREYIWHTGKTATTYTGCLRGQLGTTAMSHASGDEIYCVPDHVRNLITMRVAARALQNEVYVAAVAEGGGVSVGFADKVRDWNQTWDTELNQTFKKWAVF